MLPRQLSYTDAHNHIEDEILPRFCHSGKWKRDGAHCRTLCFFSTGMGVLRLVQVLGGAVGELAVVNEASANREVVFYGSDVVNEYAVCEGDELSHCVGYGAVECVVYFDAFDQAVGAGRKVYGAQKEEQKCFHDEIRERE